MEKLVLCVNSQTPLIRFKLQYSELLEKYGDLPDPVPLEMLEEGEDYELTPGGVPKLLFPLLKKMLRQNIAKRVHWVSLNPIGPERMTIGKISIHNISLGPQELSAYAHMKERIWEEIHDLEKRQVGPKEFEAYAKYNWACATKMFELAPIDLFYIHDFQQLQIGSMIGLAAPTVFRWHIPLQFDTIDPYIRNFMIRCLESFDAVIVSCRRDLEGLIRAGYHGRAYQIYPYIDEEKWTEPKSSDVEEFCSRFGIKEGDRIILVVGRMDRVKSQDTAIKSLAPLVHKFKNLKLMLIGDGSFSGSTRGGLSLPKGVMWRYQLENLVRELKLEDHVIFTGYLHDRLLKAAYKRAEVVVLPSVKEGFGLVVGEAWIYKKPVVVSRGAGASEIVIERTNGYTFEPMNVGELTEKLTWLLENPEASMRMGERGRETVRILSLREGIKKILEVFQDAIQKFKEGKSD